MIDITDVYLALTFLSVINVYLISIVIRAIIWGDSLYERY